MKRKGEARMTQIPGSCFCDLDTVRKPQGDEENQWEEKQWGYLIWDWASLSDTEKSSVYSQHILRLLINKRMWEKIKKLINAYNDLMYRYHRCETAWSKPKVCTDNAKCNDITIVFPLSWSKFCWTFLFFCVIQFLDHCCWIWTFGNVLCYSFYEILITGFILGLFLTPSR